MIISLGMCLSVCVCPCFQISDCDKSVQEINTDISHLVVAYVQDSDPPAQSVDIEMDRCFL